MKLLRRLCLLPVLCCAGCVLSYDASGDRTYQPYIGHSVTLTRPMNLVGVHHSWSRTGGNYTLRSARYGLAELDAVTAPDPLYARLPNGYPATIETVRDEVTGDEAVCVVYGYIVNPKTGEQASFAYKRYNDSRPLPWQLTATRHQ